MHKIHGVILTCNICGEKHKEEVTAEKLSQWAKGSVEPLFVCPNCGDDGLIHINNAHLKVLAKYIDLYNTLVDAINVELEKLNRHGVWVEFEPED
ncbi:MAG: hypothetical protein DRI91_01995 [Aquificota bacterium]|nr:MAG: hypothetical protein DRI91_01995 [Aquificota bacterium]